MKTYTVTALEKFVVRTTYHVKAKSKTEAERMCQSGEVAYDNSEPLDGEDEWLETESITAEK